MENSVWRKWVQQRDSSFGLELEQQATQDLIFTFTEPALLVRNSSVFIGELTLLGLYTTVYAAPTGIYTVCEQQLIDIDAWFLIHAFNLGLIKVLELFYSFTETLHGLILRGSNWAAAQS